MMGLCWSGEEGFVSLVLGCFSSWFNSHAIASTLLWCGGNSMGLILEARSSVPFFMTKSVAYGKAVEINDSLQKPCRRGRTLFTLFNTSDRGRNLPGLFVRGMIYQS